MIRSSPEGGRAVLEISNVEVVYNEVILVLRGLSLVVPDGKIVALLGANGAGKTTTLRAISGLLDIHEGVITKGSITFDGQRLDQMQAAAIVRAGITQVMEGRRTFADLTVDENLVCGAYTNRDRASVSSARDRVFELFPRLYQRREQVAGYMSGGEQQMLAIGRALMTTPKLLVLDEPSLGLAPKLIEQIRDIIVDINRQGTSVLLIEQNAMMALSIADYGYIMETGKIVMDGEAAKLRSDEDVKELYLGLHGEEGERSSFRDVKHYKRRKRWAS
jgi:branched-chain amino acid transport system ATP-binding protein